MTLVQRQTQWVGIVNVTPDSFSGTQDPMECLEALLRQGVDVADIGAESTRPGATPLSWKEEWQRLSSVLPQARKMLSVGIKMSVDTRHAETARRAIQAGTDWINDVSGFGDPSMVMAVKDSACTLVVMHSVSVPANPAAMLPSKADPVESVLQWGERRITTLIDSGIARERLIFDPGIGFGKTARQSMEIIERIAEFQSLKVKLMVGHSRKSFLTLLTDAPPGSRDEATIAVSRKLLGKVDYLRVHDVAGHIAAFENVRSAI
jgi:dihydropteroate synthase